MAQTDPRADRDKRNVALTSVLAAVVLTAMKLVVGVLTGSLGILAEAAHSALDLVAALVTFMAVRVSGRPADSQHPYGHGKIENLSALFETLLLLATCVWIIYEASQRLFFRSVVVEASNWAFVVMAISIAIDYGRSRSLMRAAKEHDSQALEADALHFSTDIWSSSVVIVGLVLVRIGEANANLPWLAQADAVAALGVAAIVLYISGQLGWRTVSVLLDTAPGNVGNSIEEHLLRLPQVLEVRQVRVRRSGPDAFVDLTVTVSPAVNLSEAHGIASQVEGVVQTLVPRADVVVHVEPSHLPANGHHGVVASLRQAARELGISVHGVRILRTEAGYHAEVHAEVAGGLTLAQAHEIVSRFETKVRDDIPSLADIVTHIEPMRPAQASTVVPPSDSQTGELVKAAVRLAEAMYGPGSCHDVQVTDLSGRSSVSMHCILPADISVDQAHELMEALEAALRLEYPTLDRVLLHAEPT
ncbi:MAG: cation diffusion facilitator family transporter [Anaerolineae bacterium]